MSSSDRRSPTDAKGEPPNEGKETSSAMASVREVTPEKAAEIARNLQQVFTRIGQQPIPPRLQALMDRMAEEERRDE